MTMRTIVCLISVCVLAAILTFSQSGSAGAQGNCLSNCTDSYNSCLKGAKKSASLKTACNKTFNVCTTKCKKPKLQIR